MKGGACMYNPYTGEEVLKKEIEPLTGEEIKELTKTSFNILDLSKFDQYRMRRLLKLPLSKPIEKLQYIHMRGLSFDRVDYLTALYVLDSKFMNDEYRYCTLEVHFKEHEPIRIHSAYFASMQASVQEFVDEQLQQALEEDY